MCTLPDSHDCEPFDESEVIEVLTMTDSPTLLQRARDTGEWESVIVDATKRSEEREP